MAGGKGTRMNSSLPKDLHKYILDSKYGLEYMYVSDYKLITYLKTKEWEYVPYLPLIDIKYIRFIFAEAKYD